MSDFNQIKSNIEESQKNLKKICPRCQRTNLIFIDQSLGININKEVIDFLTYRCSDCGEEFELESLPLKHFKGVDFTKYD